MRVDALDFLRGVAVIAMVIYHFFWDLGFFGYIDFSIATSGFGLFIAQIIGSSFIFISGVSLSLSYVSSKPLNKFWFRFFKLFLISALISVATFMFNRDNFIFFGIIHFLTLASLIGLILFKLKNQFIFIAVIATVVIISFYQPKFPLPWFLSWIGLNITVPHTNDFYPIFPWINFYILGCWLGLLLNTKIVNLRLLFLDKKFPFFYKGLLFSGRKSLTIYILHQPVFFSLFLIFNRILS